MHARGRRADLRRGRRHARRTAQREPRQTLGRRGRRVTVHAALRHTRVRSRAACRARTVGRAPSPHARSSRDLAERTESRLHGCNRPTSLSDSTTSTTTSVLRSSLVPGAGEAELRGSELAAGCRGSGTCAGPAGRRPARRSGTAIAGAPRRAPAEASARRCTTKTSTAQVQEMSAPRTARTFQSALRISTKSGQPSAVAELRSSAWPVMDPGQLATRRFRKRASPFRASAVQLDITFAPQPRVHRAQPGEPERGWRLLLTSTRDPSKPRQRPMAYARRFRISTSPPGSSARPWTRRARTCSRASAWSRGSATPKSWLTPSSASRPWPVSRNGAADAGARLLGAADGLLDPSRTNSSARD